MPLTYKTLLSWGLILTYIIANVDANDECACCLVTSGFVAIVATFIGLYFKPGYEKCNSDWISFNGTGLAGELNQRLYGQYIASKIVLTVMTGFMQNKNPKKPLVLSFHGTSGTGKNLVSKMIADNLYYSRKDSDYVKWFVPGTRFPDPNRMQTYKSNLQQQIKDAVRSCERTMFIFDEVDKMDPRLIQTVQPFLEYYDQIDGVSYRKAIFIFLSNSGGERITEITLELLKSGKQRDEIELSDIWGKLSAYFSKHKTLWHTALTEKNLVDFYVPFLPLEYRHVLQCAMAEMATTRQTIDRDIAARLADDQLYFPKDEKLFAVSGCKKIANQLAFYMS